MKEDKEYQAECDFRTLKEAMMIRGDKERFEKAMKMAGKEKKAIKSLAELRALANGMNESEEEESEEA